MKQWCIKSRMLVKDFGEVHDFDIGYVRITEDQGF